MLLSHVKPCSEYAEACILLFLNIFSSIYYTVAYIFVTTCKLNYCN